MKNYSEPNYTFKVCIHIPKLEYDTNGPSYQMSLWIRENLNIHRWLPVEGMTDGLYTSHLYEDSDPFCLEYKFKNEEDAVYFALKWS